MHHTIKYDESDPKVKARKAVGDVISYLGGARFRKISREARKVGRNEMPLEHFRLFASFAGVQGYPVEAWYNFMFAQ